MEKNMIKPLETILPVLESTPARWKSLCEALPQELLHRRPAPDEWSALDCLIHMIDTEKNTFPARVRAFLAGENFSAFNPDQEGTRETGQSPSALAAEFSSLRAGSVELLQTLGADDLPRTALHPELGVVTLEQMLNEWAAHDLNHTIQAERALMQPFIVESGPWRKYFADHVLALKK
jgi:hypothetical protein